MTAFGNKIIPCNHAFEMHFCMNTVKYLYHAIMHFKCIFACAPGTCIRYFAIQYASAIILMEMCAAHKRIKGATHKRIKGAAHKRVLELVGDERILSRAKGKSKKTD